MLFLATSLLSASGKQNSREAAGGQIFPAVFSLNKKQKNKKQRFFTPFLHPGFAAPLLPDTSCAKQTIMMKLGVGIQVFKDIYTDLQRS